MFTVMPKSGATQVSNAASIIFDDPPATNTPTWTNSIDGGAPSSHVLPLAASSNLPTIAVSWTADNSPPDLRDFTIYVSQDNGPYWAWRLNTTATNDTLAPPRDHKLHGYRLYSVARDVNGNVEAAPASPDATTQSTTAVGDRMATGLSLEGARPNPAIGALSVAFTLPSKEAATLELIDIAGRRLARKDVGLLGPGSHLVALSPSPTPRAGLYFLRLTQGGRVLHARVAMIR
jgi:hypothetical protein